MNRDRNYVSDDQLRGWDYSDMPDAWVRDENVVNPLQRRIPADVQARF